MSTAVTTADDRRIHPRFSALSPALVVGEGGVTGHCLVEDISAGGARISSSPALVVGEVVRVLLQLPGRGPFSLIGRVVRRFADTHGQRGHTFAVSFTKVPGHVPTSVEDTVKSLKHNPGLQEPVVLVVDESARTCLSLVRDLQRAGRKAIAVTTPLDAIEWLLDGGSHFDTAMVDAKLGNTDGCDLLSFLADEYPEVRRVLMADPLRGPHHLERARVVASPHAVLPKPWNDAQLAKIFV